MKKPFFFLRRARSKWILNEFGKIFRGVKSKGKIYQLYALLNLEKSRFLSQPGQGEKNFWPRESMFIISTELGINSRDIIINRLSCKHNKFKYISLKVILIIIIVVIIIVVVIEVRTVVVVIIIIIIIVVILITVTMVIL